MFKKRFQKPITSVFLVAFVFSLLFFPKVASDSVKNALSLCAESVIPSLFPFLVLTRLISDMRVCSPLEMLFKNVMKPLFSVSENSISPLILGFISGYPIGAAICASEYENGHLEKREAERLLAFSNNAGPAFILSTIGINIFSSLRVGVILLVIHISSAILVGLIFRISHPLTLSKAGYSYKNTSKTFSFAFTDAIYGGLKAALTITAYIVFFSVFASVLDVFLTKKLFSFIETPPLLLPVLNGIFEITCGAFGLSVNCNPETAFILISILLGWGGFCIHFQAMSFVKQTGLRMNEYFMGKLLQAAISGILAFFAVALGIFDTVNTFSYHPNSKQFFLIPYICIFSLFSLCIFLKKRWKKAKK